jgi:DNA-binding Lrp family transcriptional regulator
MMDVIDRQLIIATQSGLPLVPKPYQVIAKQLRLSADEVMQRLRKLEENGIIRRMGAVPNHYKLGYRFNGMTVWDIVDEDIDRLGDLVGKLDFVSHCYHRPRHLPQWPYNLFAMVHSKTEIGVKEQVGIITELLGKFNRQQEVLYSTRILKKTGLRIGN